MGDIGVNAGELGQMRGGQSAPKAQRTGKAWRKRGGLLTEVVADKKAARYVMGIYHVDLWTLEAMAVTAIFLAISNRVDIGVSPSKVVDFSAKNKTQQGRTIRGIAEAGRLGFMVQFKVKGGSAIDLTDKGRKVLRDYRAKFDEIVTAWETQIQSRVMEDKAVNLVEHRYLSRAAEEIKGAERAA